MDAKPKVLVVEGQMPLAMMMVHCLNLACCDSQAATTGQDAVRIASLNAFDLIVLNTELPDITGFDLFHCMTGNPNFHGSVIFISKDGSDECRHRAKNLGAVDFIAMPFDTADFVKRILGGTDRKNSKSKKRKSK